MLIGIMEHPAFKTATVVAEGDLFRRLDGAGRDGHRARREARVLLAIVFGLTECSRSA